MAHTGTKAVIKASTAISIGFHQLSSRFPEPLECLTAHLLLESSEVLGGVKPANLVSLVNRIRPCGRNLYQLWQAHYDEIITRLTGICFKVLQTRESALLLFCYNPDHLERHLAHHGIRCLLKKAGYDTSLSSEALLAELCRRIGNSDSFPHEIGLFIGYPAKDVAAFMGIVKLPFACQGPWKIYGNPTQSLCLADVHRSSRAAMGNQLTECNSPFDCLEKVSDRKTHFFHTTTDKDFQFHGVCL
ncbi:MAG: DUF3793 family protein [Verrucomicrobia bacterium]|nr:DUF3793 family protein [Deltaproteobacteria bacterium]